jgi:hypothetical protein
MNQALRHPSSAEIVNDFVQTVPVDVHGLALALGLDLASEALPDQISGKIERRERGTGFRITYNIGHSPTRQRFTIAHEIAHYILHWDMIGDGIIDDAMYRSTPQNDPIERQANSYAASILLPAPLVREKYREGVISYAAMCQLFEVSPEVARIRMRELRLGP